jgi:biopolymer transport protein ExbD
MGADVQQQDADDINGINITPLVDVSLVLVLIFMVTMPLSMIHGIDVKRQTLQRYGLATPQENIVVHLTDRAILIKDENGREQAVPYDQVGAVLSQMIRLSPAKQVFLKCDRDVPHGQTVWILDIAKQNGAADISLLGTN